MAFPAVDATSPGITLAEPDVDQSDLRHQLQQHSGFAAPAGGGWTFVPQVSLQEIFNDNVLNTTDDRRWDFITVLTPGFTLQGDLPNAQVQFSYGPALQGYARTPSQNQITQQLLGTALFTLMPEELFLDVRAAAGGAPVGGGFGALQPGLTPSLGPQFNGVGTTGLSKQNQVQTSSLSISPYWLHRFGDTGTAKIGYQLNQSSYSQGNTFIPLLFPTGHDTVHNLTNEGVAQFETGDRFAPFRNLTTLNASTSNGNGGTGSSTQYLMLNRLGYLVDRGLMVFGELGYESLSFGGLPPTRINDAVWGVGVTLTPNPDSQITIGYGHRYGENNVQLNGSYALTARTRISASYVTGLQTDLQGLAGQLDLAALDSTGRAIDSQTGAPLFIGTGGVGVQTGLFRVKSFTFSASTIWDRDQVSLSLQFSDQKTIATAPPGTFIPLGFPAPTVGSSSQSTTGFVSWLHQISDDLTMSSSASYSTGNFSTSGNQQSLSASVGMQYLISQTVAVNVSYSFFDRISSTPGFSFYQNLVMLGISKQF
ncbi:MAG: outer membrane beta-barrel protein [Acetobacteraceae bacterium]